MLRFLLFFFFITLHSAAFASIYFPNEKIRDSLLTVIKTAEKEKLADAYNQLSLYYNLVDPSKAVEYIDKALALSQSLNYSNGISFALKEKGMNMVHSGDIVKALTLVEEAKRISEKTGHHRLQGQSLHCMGLIYSEFEFYEIANRYLNEAIDAYRLAGSDFMVAYAYYDIADTYLKSRQYEKALQYVHECFALSQKLDFSTEKGPVYLLLGKIYHGLEKDSLALSNYLAALELIEKEKLHEQVKGIGLLEIGNYYLQKNDPAKANVYLLPAKTAIEKGPNLLLKGNMLCDLAEAFHLQKMHEQALVMLDSALAIARTTNSISLISKALFVKARVNKSLGQEEPAFQNLTEAYALKDSISSAGFRSLIADKVTSFEAEKAQNKILDLNSELKSKKDELDSKKTQLNLYLTAGVFVLGLLLFIIWNLLKMKRLTSQLYAVNKHVREQNVELIQLNEEKSNLIRLVAHDMRSPVNNIVSISDLMKRGDVTEAEKKEYLQLIDAICHKLDSTITKFLGSRISPEKPMVLFLETIDIGVLVKQLVKEYEPKAATKNISLEYFSTEERSVYALTDKAYVVQITSNLLSNAMKFSPHNSRIEITLSATEETFSISVKDEGPGISAEEQAALFKMYATTSNKPTGNEPSTGLGLAIARELAEGLGGTIVLSSEKGKGATFSVSIPLECVAQKGSAAMS